MSTRASLTSTSWRDVAAAHRDSIVAIILSLGAFWVYYYFEGGLLQAFALPVVLILALVSVYRLYLGYSLFFGCILLFDQHRSPFFDTLTFEISYFLNLNQTPYVSHGSGVVVTPMELHLCFLAAVWLVLLTVDRNVRFQPVSLWIPLTAFSAWLALTFIRGQATGGDFLIGLWEIRAFTYFLIVLILTPQMIRTPSEARVVITVGIVAILVKAVQGIGRFIERGFNFGGAEALTNQEDPVFMASAICLLVAMILFGVRSRQRTLLLWILIPILLGIYVGQRRAVYASLGISLFLMCLLLEGKTRRWFLVAGTLFGVLFAAYLVLYWDTYGRIGMIAQQFKSIVGASDPDMAGVDYLSNLYRDYETYNLAVTIQNSPVLGLGFGHAYEAPLGWYNLLEYFRILKYIPHNSILWVASKAGAIGVFLLLLLFNLFVCRTALTLKHIRDPWTKAVLAMAILSIVNQMIVVYVEMQLSYYRNMIYLAALIGISAVLTRHAGLDENGGVSPVRKETEDR